jgi:hypothetical protein
VVPQGALFAGQAIYDCGPLQLRIEAATLTERAAHVDERRAVLKTLQDQAGQGRAAPKRRTKPEG